MRARLLPPVAIAALLAGGAAARAEEFRCPEGTRDSGPKPNQAVRWCAVQRNGRLTFHGPVWRWYRNGQLMAKEQFVEGELEGEVPSWWEGGALSSLGSYEKGLRVGEWKFWDEQGRILHDVGYTHEGEMRDEFYSSGKKRASGTIRDGAKYGRWHLYNEDGRERARCDFGEGLFVLRPEDDDCRIIADEVEPFGFGRPVPRGHVAEDGTATLSIGPQSYAFTPPPGWVANASVGAAEGLPLVFLPVGSRFAELGRRMTVRAVLKEGRTLQVVVYEERKLIAQQVGQYQEFLLPPRKVMLGRVEAAALSYTRMTRPSAPFAFVDDEERLLGLAFIDVSPEVALAINLECDWRVPMKEWVPSFRGLIQSARKGDPRAPPAAPRRPSP